MLVKGRALSLPDSRLSTLQLLEMGVGIARMAGLVVWPRYTSSRDATVNAFVTVRQAGVLDAANLGHVRENPPIQYIGNAGKRKGAFASRLPTLHSSNTGNGSRHSSDDQPCCVDPLHLKSRCHSQRLCCWSPNGVTRCGAIS
jgi:hypothetical protein